MTCFFGDRARWPIWHTCCLKSDTRFLLVTLSVVALIVSSRVFNGLQSEVLKAVLVPNLRRETHGAGIASSVIARKTGVAGCDILNVNKRPSRIQQVRQSEPQLQIRCRRFGCCPPRRKLIGLRVPARGKRDLGPLRIELPDDESAAYPWFGPSNVAKDLLLRYFFRQACARVRTHGADRQHAPLDNPADSVLARPGGVCSHNGIA